ncbi:MAG: hypothetical protein ACI9W6_000587 [Motiliproteus sp.]|jgi:hypothetical protein
MPKSPISNMLLAWQQHTTKHLPRVGYQVAIDKDDVRKIEALAELYQLPLNDIIANLVSCSIKEVEQKMPYVQGNRIIRMEEGEPVYEDIGYTPRYLEIKQRLEHQTPNRSLQAKYDSMSEG